MGQTLVFQLVVILAVGALSVGLCQRFGLSPILGYLATGVLVGPSALAWLPDGPTTHLLAELGVVLLMFTIGLEFSLPKLLAAKKLVLGLGGAQVTVTMLLFALLGWWLGLTPVEAIVIAAALAMSSTAIVMKQLAEQMELLAAHGRVAAGILLFQDIAALLLLAILPVLVLQSADSGATLMLALIRVTGVFFGVVVVGRYLLPPVLHWVANTRSLELFMLTSLLLAISAAWIAALVGLSPTLGSFMAGMLLGETLFRYQIEADIRPFRDLMLGIFFASIGMQLDPKTFLSAPLAVVAILAALMLLKTVMLVPLARAFGQTTYDAWRAAVILAQGGEFGLLLISSAFALGLLDESLVQPLFAGLILSMVLAPLLLRDNGQLAALFAGGCITMPVSDVEQQIAGESGDFDQHVIVCGYGRLGQNLVQILNEECFSVLALDIDADRVRQAASQGDKVLFGNAVQPGVLRAAGIERACALVVTIDNAQLAERITGHVRTLGLELPILVRSRHGQDHDALIEAGAEVFPEEQEISLAFARQLLVMLNVPSDQIEARLNDIRADDYVPLQSLFHTGMESDTGRQ